MNASFPFLTGSALFAYELKKGATYRITAIYRLNGQSGDGIASSEHLMTIK
ncbi:MAG: hypothetical protein NTX50_03075 [Candidatus Sumerlaeota bacterium]|nr:hypothetical protein [Candidatus Sumerlaeota bacterium]